MSEKNKKKILIALFRFPYPAVDGTRYKILHNLLDGLRQDFTLEFFIPTTEAVSRESLDFFEKTYGPTHLFKHSRFSLILNAFFALFSGRPLQARAFVYADASAWLRENALAYDAVYVHEIRMTEYFMDIRGLDVNRVLVDFNDAISLHYRSSLRQIGLFRKALYFLEYRRVKRYEKKILNSFTFFNVVSEHDQKYLLALRGSPRRIYFACIHHGVIIPPRVVHVGQNGPNIFFIGNLNYAPNADSVKFFLRTIWPYVKSKIPELSFYVIGGGKFPQSYKKMKGVTFTGFLDDPYSVISASIALVAPIRFSGGTSTKVLEAMSFGIPVVVSREGVKGFVGLEDGENIMISDPADPDSWYRSISKIVSDGELRTRMGMEGRNLAVTQYSAEKSQQKFKEIFQGIIQGGSPEDFPVSG